MNNSTQGNLKILYIVNHFKHHGGIEKMLSLKIDAWIEEFGYEVVVVAINQEGKEIIYPPQHKFKFIDLSLKKVNQQSIVDLFKFSRRINSIIQQEKPSVVITTITGLPSLILPLLSSRVKKVLEIHSSGALSVTNSWKYKWYFLNKYNKIVLLNEDEKQYYKLDNLIVIPNFIKTEEKLPDFNSKENLVIAAGRIHPDKQYEHLLQIWNLVYKKYPDWKLEIYGNGDQQLLKMLQKFILQHKMERIQFYPAINDLNKKLEKASIYVLTSETESFSLVLTECKNAGLPAISYDCPNGPRHIISNDGILVEHNQIEKFADELSLLMSDFKRRKEYAQNAYENRIKYSPQKIIKLWNVIIS